MHYQCQHYISNWLVVDISLPYLKKKGKLKCCIDLNEKLVHIRNYVQVCFVHLFCLQLLLMSMLKSMCIAYRLIATKQLR